MSDPNADFNQRIIDTFRENGGDVPQFGRGLVLVHHVGVRSGTERTSPVMSIRDDPDTWLISGSNGGADEHPAWYRNLLAHPDVEIETPGGVVPVHVEELTGPDRDRAWDGFTRLSPGFNQYQQSTSRTIPVLALRRRPGP